MSGPLYAEVTRVIVACRCGGLPLNDHANAADAWRFAADHVALNPSHTPSMHPDTVRIPVRAA